MKNKKAIFFDLDGTLVPADLDMMFAAYFELLAKSEMIKLLSGDSKEALQIFNAAARHMMANTGRTTNDAVFFEYIQQATGRGKDYYSKHFNQFYAAVFESLSNLVQIKGVQRKILDTVLEKGYKTVLATMPVFPVPAAKSRLKWVGLEPGDFGYISHWENSSYLKPNLGFYSEILNKMGLKGEDCIMVGNNVDEDMCAQELGFDVFLVTGFEIGDYQKNAYKNGDLTALLKWVQDLPGAEV